MSVYLLGASLVTALNIPPDQLRQGGEAANRRSRTLPMAKP